MALLLLGLDRLPIASSLPLASPPSELCVIRLSAIGDTCHAVPVIRAIQEAWPRTRITWIVGKTEHSLLSGLSGVEFLVLDKARGVQGYRDLRRQLKERTFPVLLHMHASARANLVSSIVKAPLKIGFDRARARDFQWLFSNRRLPPTRHQHVMDGLFEFAEAWAFRARALAGIFPSQRQIAPLPTACSAAPSRR